MFRDLSSDLLRFSLLFLGFANLTSNPEGTDFLLLGPILIL